MLTQGNILYHNYHPVQQAPTKNEGKKKNKKKRAEPERQRRSARKSGRKHREAQKARGTSETKAVAVSRRRRDDRQTRGGRVGKDKPGAGVEAHGEVEPANKRTPSEQ